MTTYRILGTTDDVTSCHCCGRTDLKSTVVLTVLDIDGNPTGETYYGSTCAAKAVKRSARDLRDAMTRLSSRRISAEFLVERAHPLYELRAAEMDRVNATGEMDYTKRCAMLVEYERMDDIIRSDVKLAVARVGVDVSA